MKQKRCKNCRQQFTPDRPLQSVCSPLCAHQLAEKKREALVSKQKKEERKSDRERLLEMKPAKYWKALAKRWFHLSVRLRDEGKECISCDTILINTGKPGGDYDAGHCRSVGSAKHLEFDERNVHGQCKRCNDFLGGNYHEYRKKLPIRIGQEEFYALMNDEVPRNLRKQDYIELYEKYKCLAKVLIKQKEKS